MKKLLVGAALTIFCFMLYEVQAGPPKDAVKVMRPYPSICTPTLESILSAMVEDYAVHIAITFKENESSYVMIVENPNTSTMAVVHIGMDGRACLVFSGENVQRFERPEGMAPPKVDLGKKGQDT
jgi:hypothetical protein